MNAATFRTHAQRGFTLLEVLIALAIVAMAVGALLGTITSSASSVSYLRTKTLSEWVALNRLTEIRIDKQMPDTGKRTGNSEMAGMRWQYEEEVTELPIEGMFRVEVRVRPTGETVDESRERDKPTEQVEADTEASGSATAKLAWTTTVTGVVSSARSERTAPIAARFAGNPNAGPQSPGGGGGTPSPPGTPGSPGNPPTPGPRAPPNNPAPQPAPQPPPPSLER